MSSASIAISKQQWELESEQPVSDAEKAIV